MINPEVIKSALEATLITSIAFCLIAWAINFRKGGKG